MFIEHEEKKIFISSVTKKDMILGDKDIKEALNKGEIKIDPLHEDTIRENGVDLRLGRDFIRLRNFKEIYDSKSKTGEFQKEETNEFVIEPNERILTVTEEDISISNNLVGFVNLRSSYARVGIIIPPTIVDAGFSGKLTIELIGSEFPIRLHAGDRFLHVVFAKTISPVENPYKGKYAGKATVETAKF